MKILFFADNTHPTAAVSDHIRAITQHSNHDWHVMNPLVSRVLHKLDFDYFDAIGFHYSIRPHNPYYVPKPLYRKVKAFKGRKFQFLQDEYSQVQLSMDAMADLDISLLFTLVRQELIKKAYPDPRLHQTEFVTVLTGYIPENLQTIDVPPISERQTDIFYRSRACSFWLGELAQDKIRIAEGIKKVTEKLDLNIDVSVQEEDRIYGEEWIKKLSNSRAVLGTESGASIWDFTGEAEKKTRQYLQKKPYASFDEVKADVLAPFEGNILYSAISPRVFEAASLKTPMIMFPGWYSGVCFPDKHYIPLEKDFSNIHEVLDKLRDTQYLQNMADQTYQDLILSGKYQEARLAETVDSTLKPVPDFARRSTQVTPAEHIEQTLASTKLLQSFHWFCSELCFATQNFFRILFDSSTPLECKAKKLYLGAQRYFLYLKPRLRKALFKEA